MRERQSPLLETLVTHSREGVAEDEAHGFAMVAGVGEVREVYQETARTGSGSLFGKW